MAKKDYSTLMYIHPLKFSAWRKGPDGLEFWDILLGCWCKGEPITQNFNEYVNYIIDTYGLVSYRDTWCEPTYPHTT